jgi:hypothetical protein
MDTGMYFDWEQFRLLLAIVFGWCLAMYMTGNYYQKNRKD